MFPKKLQVLDHGSEPGPWTWTMLCKILYVGPYCSLLNSEKLTQNILKTFTDQKMPWKSVSKTTMWIALALFHYSSL